MAEILQFRKRTDKARRRKPRNALEHFAQEWQTGDPMVDAINSGQGISWLRQQLGDLLYQVSTHQISVEEATETITQLTERYIELQTPF